MILLRFPSAYNLPRFMFAYRLLSSLHLRRSPHLPLSLRVSCPLPLKLFIGLYIYEHPSCFRAQYFFSNPYIVFLCYRLASVYYYATLLIRLIGWPIHSNFPLPCIILCILVHFTMYTTYLTPLLSLLHSPVSTLLIFLFALLSSQQSHLFIVLFLA